MDGYVKSQSFWRTVLRQSVTGFIVAALIVGSLLLLLGNTGQQSLDQEKLIARNQAAIVQLQRDTIASQDQARDANLAQGCVLQLPVDPVTGRDASDYAWCFRQYDLPVPDTNGPGAQDATR